MRVNEDETKALVKRAQAGDDKAFYELFVAYRETVARIVHRVMGPSSEIEDVVQEVFVNVFRSIGSFRGDSKFTTWLYRLASNVTKMHLRKKKSRPRFADVPVPEQPLGRVPVETPDDALARNERVQALYRLVDELSEKKREVIVLHDFEGRSAKDIATHLDIPVLTVRTRLFYARKELYAALENEPALHGVVKGMVRRSATKSAKKTAKKKKNTAKSASTQSASAKSTNTQDEVTT